MRGDLFAHARRAMRRSPSALTSVLSYLVLRHGEISDAVYDRACACPRSGDELLQEALDPLREEAA